MVTEGLVRDAGLGWMRCGIIPVMVLQCRGKEREKDGWREIGREGRRCNGWVI